MSLSAAGAAHSGGNQKRSVEVVGRGRPRDSAAMQPSLIAPSRTRSITIDDYVDEPDTGANEMWDRSRVRPREASSSESDDDENDASRRRAQGKRKRLDSIGSLRKTSSSLSLESLQNDSDGSQDPTLTAAQHAREVDSGAKIVLQKRIVRGTHDPKRSRVESSDTDPNQHKAAGARSDSKSRAEPSRPDARSHMSTTYQGKDIARSKPPFCASPDARAPKPSQFHLAKEATCTRCKEASTPSGDGKRRCICKKGNQQTPSTNRRTTNIDGAKGGRGADFIAGRKAVAFVGEEVERAMDEEFDSERALVNIPQVQGKDGAGWDRFIFFSFRAQRFDLQTHTYLSTFSPFAAVASDMDGLSSTSVCAVCGAGGILVECKRCPLAFHGYCIDPSGKKHSYPWFCNACKAVKLEDTTEDWRPRLAPPPLPAPSTGFPRLLADVNDGNPIDLVLNPTLFNYYAEECGADWMRCCKCQEIRISEDGVLTESVRVPFECEYAFWIPEEERKCSKVSPSKRKPSSSVESVENYIRQRARRRNALFFHGFGEEDRNAFGYPQCFASGDEEVIIIDEDDPCLFNERNSTHVGAGEDASRATALQNNTSTGMRNSHPKAAEDLKRSSSTENRKSEEVDVDLGFVGGSTLMRQALPRDVRRPPDPTSVAAGASGSLPGRSTSPVHKRTGEAALDSYEGPTPRSPDGHEVSAPKVMRENHRSTTNPTPSNPVQEHRGDSVGSRPSAIFGSASVSRHDRNADTTYVPDATNQLHDRVGRAFHLDFMDAVKEEDETDDNPTRNIQREGSGAEELQQEQLELIASMEFEPNAEDVLTDMALEGNKALRQLFLAYRSNGKRFKRHASRLARRWMERESTPAQNLPQVRQPVVGSLPTNSGALHSMPELTEPGRGMIEERLYGEGTSSEPAAAFDVKDLKSDFNTRFQQLRFRQMKERQDLELQMQNEVLTAPARAIPDLDKAHAALRSELEDKHSAEKQNLYGYM